MSASEFGRTRPVPQTKIRSVSILGATGSIGSSTIDLLRRNTDHYRVEALTGYRNVDGLAKAAKDLRAKVAVIADDALYPRLKQALANSGIEAAAGDAAVVEAAQRPADWVMASISGATGLRPTLAAIERGATVALANKECLVCAGAMFMRRAAATGATVLPVDSEHNAIFQALAAGSRSDLRRIILTASGGPFRSWALDDIRSATPDQALRHPNWSMGPKVTVDSATMMNKGLEIIEAHHLFALPSAEIDVLVHPQSVVHGLAEFHDGSVVAQMGAPDMRIPISHCLAWPERMNAPTPRLDLAKLASLTFENIDPVRFPALVLARAALEAGGGAATVLNAADEIAVAAFLERRIGFFGIPALVEATLNKTAATGMISDPTTVETALAVDHNARMVAADLLPEIATRAI